MTTILWRRLDTPGHEYARISRDGEDWSLTGAAVFTELGQPVRLDYVVLCDARWHTRSGRVRGWLGDTPVALDVDAIGDGRWRLNGEEVPAVAGCLDLDLGFSPSTNLIPVRRLALPVGGAADVASAWLRVPEMTFTPLYQRYERTGERTYRYDSPSTDLTAEMRVDASGLVTHYPGLWEIEA